MECEALSLSTVIYFTEKIRLISGGIALSFNYDFLSYSICSGDDLDFAFPPV